MTHRHEDGSEHEDHLPWKNDGVRVVHGDQKFEINKYKYRLLKKLIIEFFFPNSNIC